MLYIFDMICRCPGRFALPASGLAALLLSACGTNLPLDNADGRHLDETVAGAAPAPGIPPVVTPVPLVTPPEPVAEPELFTVVAQDVPVRDLLFTMARDAAVNVDVHPGVSGSVSINAIDQTLPQILERIARQSDLRWSFDESGNLVVVPDNPFWKTYRIDYVNVSRNATTEAEVATTIDSGAGDAGGGNTSTSTATMTQNTANSFWATLGANLTAMVGGGGTAGTTANIITNPETGIVSVRATGSEHEQVAAFLNDIQTRSLYQVLIEATVVEVNLSDEYQAGVDWDLIDRNSGEINFSQNLTGNNLQIAPASVLTIDRSDTPDAIAATISMLAQFGELRVLSSPKIMALNNQAAMLRVVDNFVYFTIDVEPGTASALGGVVSPPVYTSVVHTVPVGFVMTVTPQIGQSDQVTLNVRPTISRVVRFVPDPAPILAENDISNDIPEIQVREIESILKVNSGQVAILGGLMQDTLNTTVDGLPVLSRLPGIGNLFSYREEAARKTELIVFIRPIVVKQPSLDGDLADYRDYLPGAGGLESSESELTGELIPGLNRE